MLMSLACLLIVCGILPTDASQETSTVGRDDGHHLSLQVGMTFSTAMEIIINGVSSRNVTLKYSRILNVERLAGELKDFEATRVVEPVDGERRIFLDGLQPNSEYEICAVVNDVYACEIARTDDFDKTAYVTYVSIIGVWVVSMIAIGAVFVYKCRLLRETRMKKKQQGLHWDASPQMVSTIS